MSPSQNTLRDEPDNYPTSEFTGGSETSDAFSGGALPAKALCFFERLGEGFTGRNSVGSLGEWHEHDPNVKG